MIMIMIGHRSYNHIFMSFFAVQIYDLSYIGLPVSTKEFTRTRSDMPVHSKIDSNLEMLVQ